MLHIQIMTTFYTCYPWGRRVLRIVLVEQSEGGEVDPTNCIFLISINSRVDKAMSVRPYENVDLENDKNQVCTGRDIQYPGKVVQKRRPFRPALRSRLFVRRSPDRLTLRTRRITPQSCPSQSLIYFNVILFAELITLKNTLISAYRIIGNNIKLAYNSRSVFAIAIRIIVNFTCSGEKTVDNAGDTDQYDEHYYCDQQINPPGQRAHCAMLVFGREALFAGTVIWTLAEAVPTAIRLTLGLTLVSVIIPGEA